MTVDATIIITAPNITGAAREKLSRLPPGLTHDLLLRDNHMLNPESSSNASHAATITRKTVVYLVQSGDSTGPIKIGYTSNLKSRLSQLQTSSASGCVVIGLIECLSTEHSRQKEWELHSELDFFRLEGEWFSHEIVSYLTSKSNHLIQWNLQNDKCAGFNNSAVLSSLVLVKIFSFAVTSHALKTSVLARREKIKKKVSDRLNDLILKAPMSSDIADSLKDIFTLYIAPPEPHTAYQKDDKFIIFWTGQHGMIRLTIHDDGSLFLEGDMKDGFTRSFQCTASEVCLYSFGIVNYKNKKGVGSFKVSRFGSHIRNTRYRAGNSA